MTLVTLSKPGFKTNGFKGFQKEEYIGVLNFCRALGELYGSNEFAFLYGHMSGVATVNHIAKTELIRDPDSFADIVRGLHVYGRKILRDEGVRSGVVTLS